MSEKVFGICENKCLKEVYSKNDIAVLEGNFNVSGKSYGSTYAEFPEGFTRDNTIVLSLGLKSNTNNNTLGFCFGIDNNSGNENNCNVSANVTLGLATGTEYENKIDIGVYNNYSSTRKYTYKLVLMKVD